MFSGYRSDLWRYDLSSLKWLDISANHAAGRGRQYAAFWSNNQRLFLYGGWGPKGNLCRFVYLLDTFCSWSKFVLTPMLSQNDWVQIIGKGHCMIFGLLISSKTYGSMSQTIWEETRFPVAVRDNMTHNLGGQLQMEISSFMKGHWTVRLNLKWLIVSNHSECTCSNQIFQGNSSYLS